LNWSRIKLAQQTQTRILNPRHRSYNSLSSNKEVEGFMSVRRLLVLSLLILLSVATVAAQSSSGQSPTGQSSSEKSADSASAASQGKKDSPQTRSLDSSAEGSHAQHILTLEQNDSVCYTLRTYRVARLSPESDATKPAGYSSCLRSSRFQLKTAVDTVEIAAH
jgi:hypothetical protein